jgi:hypothetical protein
MQRSRKYQFYSLWFDCSRLAIYYTTNGAYLLFCETLKSSSLEIDQGVGTFRKYKTPVIGQLINDDILRN